MIFKQKLAPEVDSEHTARQCSKCGGTGVYCMGIVDGRPFSQTGFDCFPCRGTGWVVKSKPVKKVECPRCHTRNPDNGEPHYMTRAFPDGHWGPVECKETK